MVVNLCKWASRHRKIAKSGHRVAAETIPFRRRWHGCMISVNLEAIWGMSVKICLENVVRGDGEQPLAGINEKHRAVVNYVRTIVRLPDPENRRHETRHEL